MMEFAGVRSAGSIKGFDHATGGGHDPARPAPTEVLGLEAGSCCQARSWWGQGAYVVVAQRVEDELQLAAGRGHDGDVAPTPDRDLVAERADHADRGQPLHGLHDRPPDQGRALLGDPAPVYVGVGLVVAGGQAGPGVDAA